VALCGFLAFASVLTTVKIFNDGDTFWHLATGDWILRHGGVPNADPFSYTFAGRPWQAHEWLSELLMALAFRAGGWSGLSVLFACAFGATALILAAYLRRWMSPGALLLTAAFALASGAPRLLARPHLLAMPLLAAWAFGLVAAREDGRGPPWKLLPLMLLWANLHGGFVLGLALIAPFALEAAVDSWPRPWAAIRAWGLFSLAALGLALITPHGWQGVVFALKVSDMASLPMIVEWRPADFSRISVFEIAVLEALFLCLWRGVKIPAIRLLLLLGLLHLALQHVRHQAAFALIGAMLLAEPLGRAKAGAARLGRGRQGDWGAVPAVTASLALAAVATGALRLAAPATRSDGVNAPVSALAAVPPALAARPVFNEYAFGGYLIFKGVRPFIDGRADLYGDPFLKTYAAMAKPDRATVNSELDSRHVAWTILAADNPAVPALDALPGWRRLYADKVAVVHVRRAAGPAE
jgi:hypothetical protein